MAKLSVEKKLGILNQLPHGAKKEIAEALGRHRHHVRLALTHENYNDDKVVDKALEIIEREKTKAETEVLTSN